MRKLIFFVAALSALVVILVLWRTESARPIVPATAPERSEVSAVPLADPEVDARIPVGDLPSIGERELASLPKASGLDPRCTVTIAIRSASGAEIPGGTSVVCTDDRGNNLDEDRLDAVTYRIRRLASGRYRGIVWVPEHEMASMTFDVVGGEHEKLVEVVSRPLSTAATSERRNVLVRWQAQDSQPFLAALAAARSATDDRVTLSIRTSANVSAILPFPPRAKTTSSVPASVSIERPGAPADSVALVPVPIGRRLVFEACFDEFALGSLEVAAHADEVIFRTSVPDLLADLVSVRGCVVSAAGRVPVEEFEASIEVTHQPPRSRGAEISRGCFTIDSLVPRPTKLRVVAAGAVLTLALELGAGRDVELGEIAIPDGCPYALRFTDPAGELVYHARYLSCASGDFTGKWPLIQRALTAPKGVASVTTAPVEGAMLITVAPGFALAAIALPPCGSRDEEIDVHLVPGTEVVFDVGLGTMSASVQLATSDGLPLGEHPTSATGLLTVQLAPGLYSARRTGSEELHTFRVGSESVLVELR